MLPNFVAKVTNDHRLCILLNGGMVLERFSMLRARVISAASREAAALFAEPVVTRKGGQIEVAWYSEQAGEPKPLDSLDAEARAIVAAKLRSRLDGIAPLLGSDLGPLLARALYVEGPASILAIGQEPVLIQWGILPAGVSAEDQTALDAHFAATLGPYASFPAPRIATRASALVEPPLPAAMVVPPRSVLARHPVLLGAGGLAALCALALSIPGLLPKPDPAAGAEALAHAREITKAMQDKVDQAKAALGTATCNPDGNVTPARERQGQLPPSPIAIRQGAGQLQGDMSLVARRATESVVFILTCTDRKSWTAAHKDDKDGGEPIACPALDGVAGTADLVADASGSGFFISPNRVATNTHVVENAKAIFVTSHLLGRVSRGEVEAATVKSRVDDPDFAVVKVTFPQSPPPIELAATASRLQNVVAAGYPGVITHEDAQLDRLLAGDATAAPELTTFPGFVTLTMTGSQSVPLIFSSAVIGHGNSGGPLMDLCGRAVGVNTLGWSGLAEDTGYKVNVAEGAKALAAFLDQHHIAHSIAETPCQPEAQADAASPPPGGGTPAPAASGTGQ